MFSVLDACRAGLRARYAEPHRAYHGQAHVDALLQGLAGLGAAVTDPTAIEMAIWYHDAIYDPAAWDNEARSADLLRTEMAGLAHPARLDAAELMVRLTAGHALTPQVPAGQRADCALFLDLDMAVLGAVPAVFDDYERGIAAEYVPVHGADAYRTGRAAFLRTLLAPPRLFLTDRFEAALGMAARSNIEGALRLT